MVPVIFFGQQSKIPSQYQKKREQVQQHPRGSLTISPGTSGSGTFPSPPTAARPRGGTPGNRRPQTRRRRPQTRRRPFRRPPCACQALLPLRWGSGRGSVHVRFQVADAQEDGQTLLVQAGDDGHHHHVLLLARFFSST